MAFDAFHFESYTFDDKSGVLAMRYAFSGGLSFEECVWFPIPAQKLSTAQAQAFDRALRLVFLLSGVSYYKAYVPEKLVCDAFPLDAQTAAFLESVYLNGLGEFAYRNGMKLQGKIHFLNDDDRCRPLPLAGRDREGGRPQSRISESGQTDGPPTQPSPARGEGFLVPVGGGKDSIVTIETLKKAGKKLALFAMGSADGIAAPIAATIKQAGLPAFTVKRKLSPNLLELNGQGALNGHVPITAILSAIAVATAILHGFGAVVLSNEHSADAPNLRDGDFDVNHQYSKSLAFERAFAAYVRGHVSPDVAYFSFLRPLSEAEIARRFAKLEAYRPIFRSCNKAFRQDGKARASHWCCDCPKCRFVFLALAPFMDKAKMISVFGKDMLDDPAQLEGFKELCGLAAFKPFECVGEVEESVLLIGQLARQEAWANDVVVREIAAATAMDERIFKERCARLYAARHDNEVPDDLRKLLDVESHA